MADIKVSELPVATEFGGADVLVGNVGNPAVTSQIPGNLVGSGPLVGLTIIEMSTGVWSGDAPARDPGVNPIVFVGESDPADATNGITTPANINAGDQWIDTGTA